MQAKYWFDKARKEKFALGAFNAGNSETLKAIVETAAELKSPVMVEASPGEVDFFGLNELVAEVRALEKDYQIPVILNLDHARRFESCRQALLAGFDYLHLDGSPMPYLQNVTETKKTVELSHARGLLVEGEIDRIEGSSADQRGRLAASVQSQLKYTDPIKAKQFVESTGVDTFASFVGNVHGLYQGSKTIDLELLKKIAENLPSTFLSLHGGSGIADEQIKKAIKLGVVKINVNSELRVAFHDALKQTLEGPQGNEVAIYKMMPEAIAAMKKVVKAKILLFGSAGKI